MPNANTEVAPTKPMDRRALKAAGTKAHTGNRRAVASLRPSNSDFAILAQRD
ncbi:hypothetical protein [Rhizobium sp. BG4]|uniref:hypothetical protein n=1 Tax=Rhizobium sp. BG4 TaxID=2613770 RepID=UPI00193E6186|nr:hypothetical protein [Rhizobium sp. BG4]